MSEFWKCAAFVTVAFVCMVAFATGGAYLLAWGIAP